MDIMTRMAMRPPFTPGKNPFLAPWLDLANAGFDAWIGFWTATLPRQQAAMMAEFQRQTLQAMTAPFAPPRMSEPSAAPAQRDANSRDADLPGTKMQDVTLPSLALTAMTARAPALAEDLPALAIPPKAEAQPAPKVEARPAPKVEAETVSKAEPQPAPKAEARPAPKAEAETVSKAEPQPAPKAEARPAPKAEAETVSKPKSAAAPLIQAQPSEPSPRKAPRGAVQLRATPPRKAAARKTPTAPRGTKASNRRPPRSKRH
jgi:hypothetical protein